MKFIFSTLKKTLFWSYDRGSWQYDLMCVLILAFIFFAPNRLFHTSASIRVSTERITADEIGSPAPEDLEQRIETHLSEKRGYKVRIAHIDRLTDDSGRVVYLVQEK